MKSLSLLARNTTTRPISRRPGAGSDAWVWPASAPRRLIRNAIEDAG
jgi:hypothetical protein